MKIIGHMRIIGLVVVFVMIGLVVLSVMLATVALAQQPTPIYDKVGGKQIGTIFVDGNHAYLRDINGAHYATIVRRPDNTKLLLDEHGKPLSFKELTEKLK